MANLNKMTLIGRLGSDPEVRRTASGTAVLTLSVATNDHWTDKETNEKRERTQWHQVVVWGSRAEACGQYLHEGDVIYAEGPLQTREWTDKEGAKRTTAEIVAKDVQFWGGKAKAVKKQASKKPADEADEETESDSLST